jgi:hypothetical protein
MRNPYRRLGFLFAFVSAVNSSGCAMFENRQTKLQAVKTVGIISAIGDEFTYAKGGLTGLDNRSQRVPIGSWRLDEMIVERMTTALNGRFQVQPLTYRKEAFAAVEQGPMDTSVNLFRDDPFKKLLQSEVSPQGLDAYIVLSKARSKFGSGNRKLEGVGLISYGTVLESYHQVHVLYEIRVIDGRTFDLIERRIAQPLENADAVRLGGPSRPVDEGSLITAGNPAQNEKLRATVTDIVARSLSSTLSDMHLAGMR